MPASTDFSLGPLPWSDETLVSAAWQNPRDVQYWVDEHPGRDIRDRIESIQAVLRMFERTASAFSIELARFHTETISQHLLRRNRKADLNAFEERFRELLYVFASSAMTLVDQTRALSRKIALLDYDDRVKDAFSQNPQHRFIQELRVDVIHVTLHKPGWQLTSGVDKERTSKFMLWPKQLHRASEYNVQARYFLREHSDGIDLGELIVDYTRHVQEFHSWYRGAVAASVGPTISDFERCTRRINAVSSRSLWNIVLKQVLIAGKRDPYSYLDRYLTEREHSEIKSLPFRSKQQVDRIIEFLDEFGACDEELRKTIYEAFGISDA